MNDLDKLTDKLCEELDKIARKTGNLTTGDLDTAYKLASTAKNIMRMERMDDTSESYSRDDGYSRGNSYSGKHYVRAHYSRDGADGYSRNDGRDRLLDDMRGMLSDNRYSDAEKDRIRRAIETM